MFKNDKYDIIFLKTVNFTLKLTMHIKAFYVRGNRMNKFFISDIKTFNNNIPYTSISAMILII